MKRLSDSGMLHILASGICWGFIGFFVKNVYALGLTPYQAVFYRMLLGALLLALFMMIKSPSLFRLDWKPLAMTALMGLVCQALFNYAYFQSIELNTLSAAVVLMYTAPVFAALTARLVYGELLTRAKLSAVALCLAGSYFTVTGGAVDWSVLNLTGLLFGLLSGFTYAMFPVIGKVISGKHSPLTLTFYSMLFGTLLFAPLAQARQAIFFKASLQAWGYLAMLALVSTVLPYIFYYMGMGRGVEASQAGVVSSVEVAVGIGVSVLFFGESLLYLQLFGIVLVFLSILLLQFAGRARSAPALPKSLPKAKNAE